VLFLVFAPLIGIHIGLEQLLMAVLITFLVAFSLTALGFAIAWKMESAQGFHAIINLFLLPMWMLSGALFPVSSASKWIAWPMRINPLTYGQNALQLTLFPEKASALTLALWPSIAVLTGFTVLVFMAGFVIANRRSSVPAA
jgi:ABC-2 type transport system permease protein